MMKMLLVAQAVPLVKDASSQPVGNRNAILGFRCAKTVPADPAAVWRHLCAPKAQITGECKTTMHPHKE